MVLSDTGISFLVQGRYCEEGPLFTWEANIPIEEANIPIEEEFPCFEEVREQFRW